MRDSIRCPDPETLSAFVAGNLSDEELKMTAAHLLTCEDCRYIVGEAAHTDREAIVEAPAARRRSPWWLAAAAAALLGIVYVGAWWPGRSQEKSPIAILIEATPRDGRYVEPRLSGGFPWAPLRSTSRDDAPPVDAGQMKLIGAAGVVLEKNADDPSPAAQHSAAVAHLVAGRASDAVRLLSALARTGADAQTLSDLSAARYTLAVQTSDAAKVAEALAAADAALRLDPRSPEALFNRALAVERLGLRQQARTAWERYLEVDAGSPWAREARRHLDNLAPRTDFREELTRRYAELERNPELARALAARFPQEARVWGETAILGRWAEAVKHHDDVAAQQHLAIARAFGEELASSRGDSMVKAAVAAVQQVAPENRMLLADAHLRFRAAQKTYGAGRPAEAERAFTQAAAEFERAGSPVALLARYFAANTLYDQGAIEQAKARLEVLLASAPVTFPAHRAQVEWELGLAQASLGKWGDALRVLKDSIATFESLGETRYATSVREILAQVYDRIGDPREAWHHRMVAMQELGRSDSVRLEATIFAAARAAAMNRDWLSSVSLLGLQLEIARGGGDELLYVETLLLRARLHARLSQPDSARADLARAHDAIAQLHDVAFVDRAEAEYRAVEAGLATSPPVAVSLLTDAIEFHRSKGRRMFLPELFLHRGRALVTLGRTLEAAADFESGIVELEAQRLALAAGEERWGMFATADELFDEAMALALARGDTANAFAYSERGRSRALLETLVADRRTAVAVQPSHDIAIVEFASLPSSLVIFVAAGGRLEAVQENVSRATLEADVEHLTHGAISGDAAEFAHASARLYGHLFAPIAETVRPGMAVAFVPDATLHAVSFAALASPQGRFLVEDHRIVSAPSAAIHAELARRITAAPEHNPRLLLVSGAMSRQGEPGYLAGAAREADDIAALYADTVRIAPQEANTDVFADANGAEVIHFVGHASSDEMRGPALLTSGGGADRLDVRRIASARLRRTRVVVLAACSTAEGQKRAREGSISIARAFLAAGVPSVIATLWPIDDRAAAEFFPRLHRQLARGLPPDEALRAAQLESIHRHEAPLMWAAVQVIGS